MSLDGAISNLASWAGNTMMPTMAGMFFAGAVYRYSKSGPFEHYLYGGFASLMCSGMLRALEGFVQNAGPTSANGFWMATMTRAVTDALHLGTVSFDAVKHLLLCRIERRPPRLDMENYPHLPLAQVRTTQAADYMTLLVEACA